MSLALCLRKRQTVFGHPGHNGPPPSKIGLNGRAGIIVPSGWKEVALRWKNSKAKFLFRERIFLFRDRTVVKTERSEVLAVQIEEKKNSLEEKKSLRVFTSKRTDFLAARILFLC